MIMKMDIFRKCLLDYEDFFLDESFHNYNSNYYKTIRI